LALLNAGLGRATPVLNRPDKRNAMKDALRGRLNPRPSSPYRPETDWVRQAVCQALRSGD